MLLALVIGTLAAFGFSRYPLKGNDTYLFIILTTRMLPAIVVIIPIFLMFRVTGLAGTYPGIILLYTAFNLPFTDLDDEELLRRAVARRRGCRAASTARPTSRVFFKICLPQVLAGLAATAVFGLILTWNEFLFALLLTGVETRTVPVAMAQTIGGDIGVRWGLLAAIETLFLIPVIIVTFVLQNHLLRGVTFGTDQALSRPCRRSSSARSPSTSAPSRRSTTSISRSARARSSACSAPRAAARRRRCA